MTISQTSRNLIKGLAVTLMVVIVLGVIAMWVFFKVSFRSYVNKPEGVSIVYPAQWTLIAEDLLQPGTLVSFVSPKEGPMDIFQDNVSITATDISKYNLDLQAYANLSIAQMSAVFKGSEVTSRALRLNGRPGYQITFNMPGDPMMTMVTYVFIQDGTAFNVTYMGRADRYLKTDKILVDIMVKTFRTIF